MKFDEAFFSKTKWRILGTGSYNKVYISTNDFSIGDYTGPWVLKIPTSDELLSISTRAVRKWNSINPDYPAFAVKNGWIAPYLGNTPASDEQIAKEVIEIYRRTRNIIGDAGAISSQGQATNFVVHNNEVICLDVDHAFRRGSIASDSLFFYQYQSDGKQYVKYIEHSYKPFLDECARLGHPQTANVIKTLLYLDEFYSNELKDEWITESFIKKLHVFREAEIPLSYKLRNIILAIDKVDPQGEIDNKYFTTTFISSLEEEELKNITKERLISLISEELLKSFPDKIFMEGDLTDVQFLIKHNRKLLDYQNPQGKTLLHIAIQFGYLDIIRFLLAESSISEGRIAADANSEFAMKLAFDLGDDEVVNILIEAGVSLKPISPFTQLKFAAKTGNLTLLKQLIEQDPTLIDATDDNNQTALLWAASSGQTEIVAFLIAQKADINKPTQLSSEPTHGKNNYSPLDWAISQGHAESILILKKAGALAKHTHTQIKDKSIEALIKDHDLASVKILIDNNRSLLEKDEKECCPLLYACNYGAHEIVEYFIKEGVNLDLVSNGKNHISPVRIASAKQFDSIVILLLEHGAKIPAPVQDEVHAIHVAARNGLLDQVRKLIKDEPTLINVPAQFKQTPLLWAIVRGHIDIVRFLIEQGADINRATELDPKHPAFASENNRSPLDWAISEGHTDIIKLLISHGARANYRNKQSKKDIALQTYSIFKFSETDIKVVPCSPEPKGP